MSSFLDKIAAARNEQRKALDARLAEVRRRQSVQEAEKRRIERETTKGFLESELKSPEGYKNLYSKLARETLADKFEFNTDSLGVKPNATGTPFDSYIGQTVQMPSGHVGTVKGFFQGPSGLQFIFNDGTTELAPGGYTSPASVDRFLKKAMGTDRYNALPEEQKKNLTEYYSTAGTQTLIDDFAKQNEQFAAQRKTGNEALDYLKKTLDPRLYGGYKPEQLNQFRDYYANKGLDVLKTDVEKLNQGRKAQDDALGFLKNNAFSGLYGTFKPEQLDQFGQYYGTKGIDSLKTDLQQLNSQYLVSQLQEAQKQKQQQQMFEQAQRRNQFAQSFGVPTKAGQQPQQPPPQFDQQGFVSRLSAPAKSAQKPAGQPAVQPAVQPAPNTPIQPTPSGGKFSKALQPAMQSQQPAQVMQPNQSFIPKKL